MKKRNQKLNLHRETVVRLDNLTDPSLARIAGGVVSSCGRECGCLELATGYQPIMA